MLPLSARSFDTRQSCQPTETHGLQMKEPSRKVEQSSAAPEMVTASRIPITPRVVVTGHSVSSPEESRLYSSSLSETAAPFAFNHHSYRTGQPSEAQIPGECRASFFRQPELLSSEQPELTEGKHSRSSVSHRPCGRVLALKDEVIPRPTSKVAR